MNGAILTPRAAALERIKALVLDTLPSPESKRAYGQALDDFLRWCSGEAVDGFTKATVNAYRANLEARRLSSSTINQRLSAIRKLAIEAADNGFMPPEQASAISRVKGAKQAGIRTGQWLTREQAERLISIPNPATLKGARDQALLAVLIGCGLRRREVTSLSVEHIQLRDARWVIVDLIGKGGRVRTVPMPSWTKHAIDAWMAGSGIGSGLVFRRMDKGGRVIGKSMTARSVFEIVRDAGAKIGVSNLAPHDLRRTFAKLAHKGKAALEQIQLSLGHASVTTTERYLGVRQDLTDAPCDHLGLTVEVSR
ncbi:MAG: tyrosine-type recombinase/integrase [Acidobacteriia bacterium]|nr:tyrosine-type recombinase/integrase [Terriglobia bacterium]